MNLTQKILKDHLVSGNLIPGEEILEAKAVPFHPGELLHP